MSSLKAALNDYRDARARLRMVTNELFPSQSVVRIDNPSFHGIGILMSLSSDPEYADVLLENGNTWTYRIDTITERFDEPNYWPGWVCEAKQKMRIAAHNRRFRLNKEEQSDA